MSWDNLNRFELQAIRKSLGMDVSDCATNIANLKGPRTWQRWEKGDNPIPDDIMTEMYAYAQWKSELVDSIMEENISNDPENVSLRWFHSFNDFAEYFPKCANKALWRLHQSVLAECFTCGVCGSLNDDQEVDSKSHLFKFFTKSRNIDRE